MNTLAERFAGKYITEPSCGCWLWTATLNGGYGEIKAESGNRKYKAHRVSYELHKGPIPDELVIDHMCRNPTCVNPNHLRVVTKRENTLIGFGTGAKNARKVECVNGHPFTPENTVPHSGGGRRCLECKRIQNRERKRRLRAKRNGP